MISQVHQNSTRETSSSNTSAPAPSVLTPRASTFASTESSQTPEELQRTETQSQPFHVTLKTALIKKCFGCKSEFSARYNKEPYDAILKRLDRRQYLNADRVLVTAPNKSWTYYHVNSDCCRRTVPEFEYARVLVHDETPLSEKHKNYLRSHGIMPKQKNDKIIMIGNMKIERSRKI